MKTIMKGCTWHEGCQIFLVKDVFYDKSMKSKYDEEMVQLQQIKEKSFKLFLDCSRFSMESGNF